MFKQIIAVFFVCSVLAQSANAIKCFQCKSLTDPNCAKDPLDQNGDVSKVDCDLVRKPSTMEDILPVTKCNKVVTKDKAGIIISRDCHFEVIGQKDNECTVSHSREVESCYTCKGDYCNASGAQKANVASLTTMGSAVIMVVSLIYTVL